MRILKYIIIIIRAPLFFAFNEENLIKKYTIILTTAFVKFF